MKRAIGINEIDREAMMRDEEQGLSAEQCDDMAQALLQEAAGMLRGHRKERLLELAEAYGILGQMKRMVLCRAN
ncbi:hypothetical protein [Bradyrhizobium sp. USDA 3650]